MTVFGGDANDTAQCYDLSINGPIAGYCQIIRDINTLNVNITSSLQRISSSLIRSSP
ncbi:MAG: hypothetical protein ACLPI9_02315 [Halobacteriota archaeon]